MRRGLIALTALAVLLSVVPSAVGAADAGTGVDCTFPITVTDGTGSDVTVAEEPERVVAVAPSGAQTMWAIGAEDKVVGMPVNQYTGYLNGSTDRANVVGSQGLPVAERIVAQEPDLVLASGINTNETVRSLRGLDGLDAPVVRVPAALSLDDVHTKVETVGRLVGEFDGAAAVAAEMRGEAAAVREAVDGEPRPTVYYAMGGGWTAGPDTFIGHLIDAAGGSNVATAADISTYREISQEVLVDEDPDWIVLGEGSPVPSNPAVNASTAVTDDQVLRVDSNFLNQPGPRTLGPLRRMASAFHPDADVPGAVEAATPVEPTRCASEVAPATTAGPTTSAPATTDGSSGTTTVPPATPTATETATETAGGGGPGFDAALGLGALLGTALLARRLAD